MSFNVSSFNIDFIHKFNFPIRFIQYSFSKTRIRFTSTFSSLRYGSTSHPITFLTQPHVPTFLRYGSTSITSQYHMTFTFTFSVSIDTLFWTGFGLISFYLLPIRRPFIHFNFHPSNTGFIQNFDFPVRFIQYYFSKTEMRFTSTFSSLRNGCKSHPITFLTQPYVPTFLRYGSISITSIEHTIQIHLLRLNQYIHLYMIRISFILFISVTAFFHFISPLTLHLYPILSRLRTPFLSFTSDSASFHSFQFSFILQTFH